LKFIWILVLALPLMSHAGEAVPASQNPELEKRVTALTLELRCLQCQNQTIADSHADLAIDLKNQVREMMVQGKSDQEIIDFMVQRYGDFVLFRPPVKSTTWLLWFGPILLMAGGLGFLGWKLSHRVSAPETLPDADLQHAADLLGATSETKEST
jgi:cytochrome c-type biogenesis protein CcmH